MGVQDKQSIRVNKFGVHYNTPSVNLQICVKFNTHHAMLSKKCSKDHSSLILHVLAANWKTKNNTTILRSGEDMNISCKFVVIFYVFFFINTISGLLYFDHISH